MNTQADPDTDSRATQVRDLTDMSGTLGSVFGSSDDTEAEGSGPETHEKHRGEGAPHKRLTLSFRDLTVRVRASSEALGETLWSRVDPTQLKGLLWKGSRPKRTILHKVTGQVRPGEMLLVLGRPGSGCSSLLRVLSNSRESFDEVVGETRYGSMDHVEARRYRQQIVMNTEDDIHFPTLTVNETMKFALGNKIPRERPPELSEKGEFEKSTRRGILDTLGIAHTKKTLVGNEFVRGVSGGERKRVSLAEVLATQVCVNLGIWVGDAVPPGEYTSPVKLWDLPTSGLDSRAALEFTKALREDASRGGETVVMTMYQAGNGIFDQFDKVLVLAEGRVIYYGPSATAKQYFQGMGFVFPSGANVSDFLTSVTVMTERVVAEGYEGKVPNTPEEFEAAYQGSSTCRLMEEEFWAPEGLEEEVEDLRVAVEAEKRESSVKAEGRSVYTAGLGEQIINCTIRQFQIMAGNKVSIVIKITSALLQALVCGSLFYDMPLTSESIYLRPGLLWFPILHFLLDSMSEVTASFMGRPIVSRHRRLGFSRPTAFCIANAITDIPVAMVQMTIFSLILYFMTSLQMDAGKFFTFWIVVNANTLCLVQLFRAIGAVFGNFGTASLVSGLLSTVFFVYGGYVIPFGKMPVWFRWIFYLNPAAYAFESLMANEFDGLTLDCVAPQYIPFGESYANVSSEYKGCTIPGSDGSGIIDGLAYIDQRHDYSAGHIWRGLGVLLGLWVFFICVTSLASELKSSHGDSSVLLFKRSFRNKNAAPDVEKTAAGGQVPAGQKGTVALDSVRQSTFSWHDLDYHVKYQGAQKQLLDKVFGYVQPGNLVALMGASGAGKTTLLDVLAQRKDSGEIHGSILLDGKPQGVSFQRTTGYCEQMDVHEGTATVREALIFSAVLRQPREVTYEEKIEYVDYILDLLELDDISDALIGVPGAGLSIEQRKRVTLGVELVAKPTLLFLDEPTSGLDSQSAFNIIRFLKKLASGGQAVLCTIHQPSAVLFDAFDSLLLLSKGGRMAYFGETGKDSQTLLDYFARSGAPCGEGTNPAEHIVEVIQGSADAAAAIDWVDVWNKSPERQAALETLHRLEAEALARSRDVPEDTASFATTKWFQFKTVLYRQMVQLWRSPDYMWSKINLHIFAALFSGFTFWKLGNGTFDLQLRMFAVFNFVFVAPGCINQMQPFFLKNRDLFETREKKSKTYHWVAFIGAQVISEIPYLILCAVLYFVCWYFAAGFPIEARVSGHFFLQMIFYELLYTSIGQAIAAYAPNEYAAANMNPVIVGAGLVAFAGIVVPYAEMQAFWKYWIYWLDPFHYLVVGLFGTVVWDVEVECDPGEYSVFAIPEGETCGGYMADFLEGNAGYVRDPSATGSCEYCAFKTGAEYAATFNITEEYHAWRDTGITALFCLSSYALVFLMMKLRSKKTKSARSE